MDTFKIMLVAVTLSACVYNPTVTNVYVNQPSTITTKTLASGIDNPTKTEYITLPSETIVEKVGCEPFTLPELGEPTQPPKVDSERLTDKTYQYSFVQQLISHLTVVDSEQETFRNILAAAIMEHRDTCL